MAGAPAPGPRQPRRGPAPFASFDHDVSDESSPESKQTCQLPEIREDPAGASPAGSGLAPPEQRPRSASTPGPATGPAPGAPSAAGALRAPAAPRIDISRASSSSHHDSRDSSPELALFAGAEDGARRLELGFREDGALELRSSTEELAFLEPAPAPPAAAAPAPPTRRHSRKDSQGSEAALLGVSGRTSRLSSVGSQCSALSGFSRASRLSVVSGASRSPSPHKMLLETSFCGPKPIEAEPEICAAAVEERLLRLVRGAPPSTAPEPGLAANTRDRREVRTEATVESGPPARAAPAPAPEPACAPAPEDEKRQKESRNRARAGRSRERRDRPEPEVYRPGNRSKDVIRIKLKPDDEYEDDEDEESEPSGGAGVEPRKPATLALGAASPERRRTPSPATASRKSSFCSLFKSRELAASPDSPSAALRRKKSLTEGRARSKSRDRDRSATPTSAAKIRGSVLSLFRTPRRSAAASPSPGSRAASPPAPAPGRRHAQAGDVVRIPLRTPSDERAGPSGAAPARPASAPQPPRAPSPPAPPAPAAPPVRRTVLPDGSILIPLRSPTEREPPALPVTPAAPAEPAPDSGVVTPDSRRSVTTSESRRSVVTPESRRSLVTSESRHLDDSRNGDARTESGSDEGRPAAPAPGATPDGAPDAGAGLDSPADDAAGRKRRLVFSTHVGSRDQVFCTQFSITKTPSVTSEISGGAPSFAEPGEPPPLRDTRIGAEPAPAVPRGLARAASPPGPAEAARDSSGSEPSSGAATPAARGGSEAERRGLVVQESFEDELPYVPTTLPLERPLALPMVPVRERGPRAAPAGLRRPRAAAPPAPAAPAPLPAPPAPLPTPPAPAPPAAAEKLRIRLPRRPRTASAGAPTRTDRPRTRSGGDAGEPRTKSEWIDFSEVPERRKQPKRIQTLPAGAAGPAGDAGDAAGGVVFSYVEPEHCRCECHAAARRDDELPLLAGAPAAPDLSSPEDATEFTCRAAPVPPEPDSPPARPSSRRH